MFDTSLTRTVLQENVSYFRLISEARISRKFEIQTLKHAVSLTGLNAMYKRRL